MYHLAEQVDGKDFKRMDDWPAFVDGKQAGEFAKLLSAALGKKVQPRRDSPPDTNWRAREEKRFADGIYKPVVWATELPPIDGHYAHIAFKDPSKVAFTRDEERGVYDIQTFMSPGKYLKEFYPNLTAKQIQTFALRASQVASRIKFATTPEEMEYVYWNSPWSCMSGWVQSKPDTPDMKILSPVHPATVYAAGDLAVAYIEADDPSKSSRPIIARSLVWPERQTYGRFYGDGPSLKTALDDLGYQHGDPVDARLLKIPVKNNQGLDLLVLPYLDRGSDAGMGHLGVLVADDHLIIKNHNNTRADYTAHRTSGLNHDVSVGWLTETTWAKKKTIALAQTKRQTNPDLFRCQRSGILVDEEGELSTVILNDMGPPQRWCDVAIQGAIAAGEIERCMESGNHYAMPMLTRITQVNDDNTTFYRYVMSQMLGTRYMRCQRTHEYYHRNSLVNVMTLEGMQRWGSNVAGTQAGYCSATSTHYELAMMAIYVQSDATDEYSPGYGMGRQINRALASERGYPADEATIKKLPKSLREHIASAGLVVYIDKRGLRFNDAVEETGTYYGGAVNTAISKSSMKSRIKKVPASAAEVMARPAPLPVDFQVRIDEEENQF